MQLNYIHTELLRKHLCIKFKHTNTSVNTWIHSKIKINIYMQHIQAIPIKINIVIIAHMITHKNMHINNNAACKFITQLTLILVRISPIACTPSMNLPALDHTAHHSQQWVTPKLELNSTWVNGFLTRLMDLRHRKDSVTSAN